MSTLVRGGAPTRHVYDAVIIGGQLSGVLCAARLAKRGLQVLLVPHDGSSAAYPAGDRSFPHAPFLLPPLKALPGLHSLLEELGAATSLSRLAKTTPLQLLSPGRWFEVSHDEKHRGPELSRALGDEAEAFDERLRKAEHDGDATDRFFSDGPELPPEGLWARWSLKRQLHRWPELERASTLASDEAVTRLLPFVQHVASPAEVGRQRTLGKVLQGPVRFPGGREGLWASLGERAKELGVDVLGPTEAVERLTIERGGVGVRLARHDTTYRGGFLIVACDLDPLTKVLPEKEQRAAAKLTPSVESSRAIATFHFVVPEAAVPPGFGSLALLEANPPLLLELGPPEKGQRVMSVSVVAQQSVKRGGESAVRELQASVVQSLEAYLPFTLQHVVHRSTPWLDAPHVVDGRCEPHPLFELDDAAWLGLTGVTTQSPWRRVLFANRQVLPGLGLEGEAIAAARAADRIERALAKNDPLKRK